MKISAGKVEKLLAEIKQADFVRAMEIEQELKNSGITWDMTKEGIYWSREKGAHNED